MFARREKILTFRPSLNKIDAFHCCRQLLVCERIMFEAGVTMFNSVRLVSKKLGIAEVLAMEQSHKHAFSPFKFHTELNGKQWLLGELGK